ncbi:PREDICTED: mitochondrial carrier homolog 2-like [Polistes dominula]|uniref:Mitochondrial carrier homolog 2-like n=1 Tax=Polistes dominula TaxID=743375 RepID=A0ABM1HUH4_POLDO|nr:PREDICTED: mitochondrial carrier homolog 2-like [Polistes dominula]XP_015171613.1 PREDICTED: mitochondrial carrier homolog 2-like [Polistes dominula]XP_015171614.1 PREDICTED: mitochondrial carrier homolog 2-like [Polistes dominula]XP_015171615.1 PREDICTED: mitochondrial carrier homolog 2-like [Polistes dominula]
MISQRENVWSNIPIRMFINTISHPVDYAKVLIQIGHEPIPPRQTFTLFGKPALALPNVFQYVKYIKSVDGFAGCYRGLVPKLCAYTLSAVAFEKTSECITFSDEPDKNKDDEELTEPERRTRCIHELIRDLISRMVGIIVSHPLDVIMLRMMAQFVGGETKYNGIVRSFIEVYKENGIAGYYAGIIPRLIANAAVLVLVSSSTYVINKYIIHDQELKTYTASTMKFIATTVTYPFLVVSHCMAVNNCGLVAGLPPNMPIYNNWLDCWSHLSSINQVKRGSSLLWRYYTGPRIIVKGKAIPINTDYFNADKIQ